jgi:serine/threonine protein kinase
VQRTHSPAPVNMARLSAPEVGSWNEQVSAPGPRDDESIHDYLRDTATLSPVDSGPYNHYDNASLQVDGVDRVDGVDDGLEQELERKWILNLSMHFRDKSEREKFFVTYAEKPNRWRRVTVSCDYRDAPPDSLEQDLKELHYQRDKSARIYESIRESLQEIQFYDTVTNLKLETSDGRLHVHVTEDVNETIPYPPLSSVRHLGGRQIPEYDLVFDSHLSGFVYKVRLDGRSYIKKEIPGPDTVDEFLYEINALHALYGSKSVIQFEGIIVDDNREKVKGLLISYAEQGALVDVLYDFRGQLPLSRRERWARQIIQGLCEIHESGYVQGDFTLSNIVIDGNDNAKIIDINRRGCPVGWEPPEIAAKIESNQRISMYIGVKSDLFQLGMTLWALAMQEDEPERQPRPLFIPVDVKIPDYYRRVIAHCLSDRPRDRLSAKELLAMFPADPKEQQPVMPPWAIHTGPPVYDSIQLDAKPHSVCLDEEHHPNRPGVVYVTPAEYEQEIDYPPRGRRPSSSHVLSPSDYQPSTYLPSSASPNPDGRRSISQSDFEFNRPSPDVRVEPRFEEVEVNGTQYLVNPDMFSAEDFEALRDNTHEPHDSQELQSGRSSNLSRRVVPSSVGDVERDSSSEFQLHEGKAGSNEEAGNFQNKSSPSASKSTPSTVPYMAESIDSLDKQPPKTSPTRKTSTTPLNTNASAASHDIKTPLVNENIVTKTQTTKDSSKSSPTAKTSTPLNTTSYAAPQNIKTPLVNESSVVKTQITEDSSKSSPTAKMSPPLNTNNSTASQNTKTPLVNENIVARTQTTEDNSKQQDTSLLGSRLPINPALPQAQVPLPIPTVKSVKPTTNLPPITYLLDSVLPINPASKINHRDRMKA